MTSRMLRKFAHMHVTHPEIKPLTFSVCFGSVVAVSFPIYSYCQNMMVGMGKEYTKDKQLRWYNYFMPTNRQHYGKNDPEVEKLRNEIFNETNKKS